MKLLALECSAAAAGVALYEEERLLAEQFCNITQTHSATLLPMAEALLHQTGTRSEEIGCYAISSGPGSFTGLRIGIAAVKGMAFPHNTPCIGVSTLETIAYGLLGFEGTIAAVMDARCRQVSGALFEAHGGALHRITGDAGIAITELAGQMKTCPGPIWLAGDGAALTFDALRDSGLPLHLAPEPVRFQRASAVGLCALHHREEATAPAALMPRYLRPANAVTLADREKK